MVEKTIIDWKTDEQFRKNAKWFYQECKNKLRMPYSEDVFVETVCAIYEVMRKENKADITLIKKKAINAIKTTCPDSRIRDIRSLVIHVIDGEGVGNEPYGRWFDFCCEYRYKIMKRYSLRNEYCKKIADKERKIINYHVPTKLQRDIIHLAITIELL